MAVNSSCQRKSCTITPLYLATPRVDLPSEYLRVAVGTRIAPAPAQIPACAANAPGLYEDAAVKDISVVFSDRDSHLVRRVVKPRSREAVCPRRKA
jgi:hypothetical protein